MIEWRGLDPPFVQDLIEHLRPPVNLSVCNGRAGQGDVAITKLREGGLEMAHMFDGDAGFSELMSSTSGGTMRGCPTMGDQSSSAPRRGHAIAMAP